MEKKRRRNSQVFNFEQTDEALEENEALKDLYQNKKFVLPEPSELETIIEEGARKEVHRARRGTPSISEDGGLVLGVGKSKRLIEGYKFWKQDDKDRIRKRKSMMTKQWRGRKRPKVLYLDLDGEQRLQLLIDTREESESEEDQRREEECTQRLHGVGRSQIVCVWGKGKEGSGSSVEDIEGCVWGTGVNKGAECPEEEPNLAAIIMEGTGENNLYRSNLKELSSEKASVSVGRRGRSAKENVKGGKNVPAAVDIGPAVVIPPSIDDHEVTKPRVEVTQSTLETNAAVSCRDESSLAEVSLATLCGMIPEGELAEILETEDLLFCGNKEEVITRGARESTRRSVRRSARLQNTSTFTGSVFTEEELPGEERNVEKGKQGEVLTKEITRKDDSMPRESNRDGSLIAAKLTIHETDNVPSTVCEVNDEVFKSNNVDENQESRSEICLELPALTRPIFSDVSNAEALTPTPLSDVSKENFFMNQIPRLKVAKTGKTKRRVKDRQSHINTDDRTDSVVPCGTDSVLKDLSNLSLNSKAQHKTKTTETKASSKRQASSRRKLKNEGTTIKPKSKATVDSCDKAPVVSGKNVTKSIPANSRTKKSVVGVDPDTSDESFCFSGNLGSGGGLGGKSRRESLRTGVQVNYCEESERSGTVSRRTSGEGSKNSSLERSKRNSLLVISGEKEIDISMPAAVRRSLTGEFVPKLNLPTSTELVVEVAKEVKSASSVGDAFCSDSEEEEIISGIFGKKTLQPWRQKQKKKIDRGFLEKLEK